MLEDYADVAEGFLALASVTGEGVWLEFAGFLLDHVIVQFTDAESGSLYDTAGDAEQLIHAAAGSDGQRHALRLERGGRGAAELCRPDRRPTPSHRRRAGVGRGEGARAARARFIGWGLAVAEALLDGPREVAIVGPGDDPATKALHRTALLATAPGAVVAVGAPESDELPLLSGRPLVNGKPAAYVCRNFTCDTPTTDPDRLGTALSG